MINKLEQLCTDQEFKKQYLQNEDRKSTLDLKIKLNFVESKNKKQSQTMKMAFTMAKDTNFNPVWITYDQALSMSKETKPHVFIIDSFKTDLFDCLKKNNFFHIFGPSCIFYCDKKLPLPSRRFPLFNLCMRNLEICIDKNTIDQTEFVQIFGLVNLMAGKLSHVFRPTTTHLISTNYLTDKSQLARTYGIPIMKKEWINFCWEKSLSSELLADDKSIISKFRLPVFHGFRINISQIDDGPKNKIQALIQKYGGENIEFNPKNLTHLILGKAIGSKYEAAKRMIKIKIMKEDWINDSIKNGYALIEHNYLFEPLNSQVYKFDFSQYSSLMQSIIEQPRTSSSQIITQEVNSQISCQTNLQTQTRFEFNPKSQIITPRETQASSQNTSSQLIEEADDLEQQLTQKDNLKPPQPDGKTYCVKSKEELIKDNFLENQQPKRTVFSVLTSSSQLTKQPNKIPNIKEELENLVNRLNNCRSSTFDGCDFYIHDNNLEQNIKILLKRCISLQNGTVSTSLRQSVSHVIVKDNFSETERNKLNLELDKFDHTINQVNLKWIIQCSKSNKLQSTIDLNSLTQSNQPEDKLESLSNKHQKLSQQSIRSQTRRTRLARQCAVSQNSQAPIAQPLPIKEILPNKNHDDIFNEYSDNVSTSAFQSQTINNSQVQCALDLELMRKEDKPLYKCVLTISSYPIVLKEELTKIAERLGATCQQGLLRTDKPKDGKHKNTHLVCDEAIGLKYERAQTWGIHCVNQQWLRKCEELVKHIDEKDYGPKEIDSKNRETGANKVTTADEEIVSSSNVTSTTNSTDNLTGENSKTSQSNSNSQSSTGTSNFNFAIHNVTSTPDPTNEDANSTLVNRSVITTSSQNNLQSKLNDLKIVLNSKDQKMTKITDGSFSTSATQISTKLTTKVSTVSNTQPEKLVDSIASKKLDPNSKIDILNDNFFKSSPIKHNVPIAWSEKLKKSMENSSFSLPANFEQPQSTFYQTNRTGVLSERTLLRDQLIGNKEVQPFSIYEDSHPLSQINANIKFGFSGFSTEERDIFAKELNKIKIKVAHDVGFQYLITKEDRLIKNEIFFISLANGKWIEHPDFCRETLQLGTIPDPEKYEWGSNEEYLKKLDPKFVQLAKSCRYWRLKVAETKKPAFYGQTHAIISTNAKSYASVIINGGGQAIPFDIRSTDKESYMQVINQIHKKIKNGSLNVDFVLINYKKKDNQLGLSSLVKPIQELNIKCCSIDYISMFLAFAKNFDLNSVLINPISSSSLKRCNSGDSSKSNTKIARK